MRKICVNPCHLHSGVLTGAVTRIFKSQNFGWGLGCLGALLISTSATATLQVWKQDQKPTVGGGRNLQGLVGKRSLLCVLFL